MPLSPLAMLCFFMVFQHRSRSYLGGSLAVPSRFLRAFFDVFVLPLLFCAHSSQMLSSWHCVLQSRRNAPSL